MSAVISKAEEIGPWGIAALFLVAQWMVPWGGLLDGVATLVIGGICWWQGRQSGKPA